MTASEAPNAHTLVERREASGVGPGAFGERSVRAVTHIGVPSSEIDRIVQIVALAVNGNEGSRTARHRR